ncbi:MAG: hypothetical protein HZB29_13905 [Nitrospinae bacterium]|nr:hypothetical protein [Nitrospinota bacterium]
MSFIKNVASRSKSAPGKANVNQPKPARRPSGVYASATSSRSAVMANVRRYILRTGRTDIFSGEPQV